MLGLNCFGNVIPRGICRPDRCARDQPYNYHRKSSVIICSFVSERGEEERENIHAIIERIRSLSEDLQKDKSLERREVKWWTLKTVVNRIEVCWIKLYESPQTRFNWIAGNCYSSRCAWNAILPAAKWWFYFRSDIYMRSPRGTI